MSRSIGHYKQRRKMNTPMWWHHMTTIEPHRTKESMLLKKIKGNPDIADSAIFPHDKKPYDYFY